MYLVARAGLGQHWAGLGAQLQEPPRPASTGQMAPPAVLSQVGWTPCGLVQVGCRWPCVRHEPLAELHTGSILGQGPTRW